MNGLPSKLPDMLYHYAITPEAFEHSAINEMMPAGVVLVELLRGMCDSGLLADLDAGRWMTQVRRNQQQGGIPPSVKDHIDSCLKVLSSRNRLVRHPAGSVAYEKDDFRWLKWSIERNLVCQFAAVFSSDAYIELSEMTDEILVPLSAALHASNWIGRQRSVRFIKTESNLRSRLAPLLAYAQKLTLIDPYMSCRESRFLNTVQHCADLLGKHDCTRAPGRILIHAGDPQKVGPEEYRESKGNRLARWKTALEPFARHWQHSFQVFLWTRRPGGKQFHDRYLITDQCGIDIPGGLDFLPDADAQRANQSTCSMLEARDIDAILYEEFHSVKSPYFLLDTIRVVP